MSQRRFAIVQTPQEEIWAAQERDSVVVRRNSPSAEASEALFEISTADLRRLVAWAEPAWLTVSFSGQLAREINDAAKEVGMSAENFAIEAVNAYIQASQMNLH